MPGVKDTEEGGGDSTRNQQCLEGTAVLRCEGTAVAASVVVDRENLLLQPGAQQGRLEAAVRRGMKTLPPLLSVPRLLQAPEINRKPLGRAAQMMHCAEVGLLGRREGQPGAGGGR